MIKRKSKAFTLIELIATLVIMAIIALIATPLVMTIIRSARISADKRSVDAYGRSIELAIAGYLLDTGKFPTSVEQLTIEYSGNEVECSKTQINSDSSVYLTGCTVAGRSVDNYTYGEDKTPQVPTYTAYSVGDHVSYNGVTYYVIEDSDTTNDTVKLLKENPITKTEMDDLNLTGITIEESNGYGRVQYGSSTDYSTSTVKQVVDAWENTAVKSGDTSSARLITYDETLPVEKEYDPCNNCGAIATGIFVNYDWMYNNNCYYWTMTPERNTEQMRDVDSNGFIGAKPISVPSGIRPVLELNKQADITKLD